MNNNNQPNIPNGKRLPIRRRRRRSSAPNPRILPETAARIDAARASPPSQLQTASSPARPDPLARDNPTLPQNAVTPHPCQENSTPSQNLENNQAATPHPSTPPLQTIAHRTPQTPTLAFSFDEPELPSGPSIMPPLILPPNVRDHS